MAVDQNSHEPLEDPRAERARLEAQPANIAAAAAQTSGEEQRLKREHAELAKQLTRARHRWATEGPSEAVTKEMTKLDRRLASVPGEQQRIAEKHAATARARRQNAEELQQHLKANMDTFQADALKSAAEAESKLRALATAFQEASRAWEAAASEWAILARPLTELLKERDEAAGIWRDPNHYAQAGRVQPFPLSTTVLVAKSRPAAVDLLKEPARPDKRPLMRRVA